MQRVVQKKKKRFGLWETFRRVWNSERLASPKENEELAVPHPSFQPHAVKDPSLLSSREVTAHSQFCQFWALWLLTPSASGVSPSEAGVLWLWKNRLDSQLLPPEKPSTGLDGDRNTRSLAGKQKEQFSGSLASEQNLRAQHGPNLTDEERDQRGK